MNTQPMICRTRAELNIALGSIRHAGKTLALVPTMGALHAGHMALVHEAKRHADVVMLYIFVNPLQFGPNEDFERYPRPFEEDVRQCTENGVHYLYAPTTEDMYPEGYSTIVSVKGVSDSMEGIRRPGHFDGVATVLAKMFIRIRPEVAIFGEKDYQQLAVVRRMVADLDLPVRIVGLPTIREKLALSSRNAYLSEKERAIAPILYETLCWARDQITSGAHIEKTLMEARQTVLAAGFASVDYIDLRDADSLQPITALTRPARLLAAATLGTTRLIDNIPVMG